MATIVGGIATSHTPTIGFALDAKKQNDPVWAPIFAGYEPVRAWLAERKPDVLVMIYNDHITSFFFDHYSQFALGVGDRYWPADEGGGPRHLPSIAGHPALAQHIATSLVADEFDLAYLRCAVESFPEDLKVAIVGTGGLSHQVHGERAGFNNTPWDMEFLELLEKDPEQLTHLTIAEYAKRGGLEGSEVIMWLLMRGALTQRVRKLHQSYYLPSMTPIATLIFENVPEADGAESAAAHRARIGREWQGIEQLPGTYPFTLDRSVKAYRLNHFLHELIRPDYRRRFLAEPEVMFAEADLSDAERDLVRRRDWLGLIRYGVIFFLLEKLAAVVGTTNLHVYAAFRGLTLEEFQKTRNAQILYSVAGN